MLIDITPQEAHILNTLIKRELQHIKTPNLSLTLKLQDKINIAVDTHNMLDKGF